MESSPPGATGFSAELAFLPFFNLALQQSTLPVVSELKLKNHLGRDLVDIECEFSANPLFLLPKTIRVERLENGEELPLHNLGIELDYSLLASLSEAAKGKIRLEIRSGGEPLFSQEYEVTAYAADQWLGLAVMPELLAAFVTPNLEAVSSLQSVVAEELQRATGDSSIQGYQADKTRVYEICSAIYRAIHSWGIHYSNPAASFGTPGQRIRFADAIRQFRLGTCLDTAVLFASVMEQCGLHPVILLQEGHAYVGCHLVNRYFPDIPMDDLQMIRKLVDLDEFLVLETTGVTRNETFSVAEASARTNHLNIDSDFQCAIDVIRARCSGIRPLPLLRSTGGVELQPENLSRGETLGEEHRRQLEQEVDLERLRNLSNAPGRVERWTQKLLDLSLRNRLLNVRDTRQVIPIACTDIALLEDKIAADQLLSLHPLSNLLSEKDLHDLSMLRGCEVGCEIKQLLDQELAQRRLWTMLSPQETVRRLTGLYRQGRTDLEEGGVNTLFLAVGFLEWKVSERDEKSYLAPILLIPIRLLRKSVAEGIRIARLDEDTVINETLLELLRSQYRLTVPGVAPLPTDDSGVDVHLVMQIFRQTIREMKGWEVREEARIGHFSFGKFIMWNDMTARLDALKQNPLVSHLIEGGGIFDDGIDVFPPGEIGAHLDWKHLYCPMSADSSQLTAVLYSQLGKSFVLHGPPGTGKSQTITNIIGHNLALGRRVLFVSEKKAALEVVHRRLSSIGLRPFCLELHSNKAGKIEVAAQFSEALHVPETPPSGQWESLAENLEKLRGELDGYVRELHRKYPNGFSANDCFSLLFRRTEQLPEKLLEIDCLRHTREEYEETERLVADLATAWSETSPEAVASLEWLALAEWSPVFERELLGSARSLLSAAGKLSDRFRALGGALGLTWNGKLAFLYRAALLAEALKRCGTVPAPFLSGEFPQRAALLETFAENDLAGRELAEKLQNYRLELTAELDFAGISARIEENAQAFLLSRFFRNRALLRELAGLKKLGGSRLTIAELIRVLPDLEKYAVCRRATGGAGEEVKTLLGSLWNSGEPDWRVLKPAMEQARKIHRLVDSLAETAEGVKEPLLAALRTLLPEAERHFAANAPLRSRINDLLRAWNEFQECVQTFSGYAPGAGTAGELEEVEAVAGQVLSGAGMVRGVLRYRRLKAEAGAKGVAGFAAALETGCVKPAEAAGMFEFVYGWEMLNQILAQSPLLCSFTGSGREESIRRFCELDRKYTALSRRIVYARLAARLPRRRSGPCPEGSELGLLKRECEKRARLKPVRMLLEQIPTLAPVLKPCFLMSPLSVAQYLPPDTAPFDLIVFDEASQIPVWDSIGVIARGRQLIVVGDPKQMPPTSFFQKGEAEDEERGPDELEDMESILDECIAAGVHSACLNWHYRSRHESLIAFSNHYYYEDRLFTFPAACNSERLGVRFEFVPDGVYDRRGTRTNRREAEALVRYLFDRLRDPNWKPRSLGIVTFSQAQKDLIEDMIEQERAAYPELERCFSDRNEEPPFVKNLENVQGDERDVILFSICYAADAAGKFSMNFGPLNRQGGERRLNVAITRAREQVVVFSSIHAAQIDLARTGAEGAAHLKYFLDYAEKGIPVSVPVPGGARGGKAGLAELIAGFLTSHGFLVERNVGRSGCRIDLAVRNPERTSEFLLGIECDGENYAGQRTARDRDHLRESVLRSLGWHIFRAWSVDWAFDRQRSEQKLLALIERLRREPKETESKREPESEPEPEPVPVPVHEPESAEPPPKPSISAHRREYRIWVNRELLPQELFYESSGRPLIRKQMREVVQQEGPICESLLKKRLVRAWGFSRTGETIQNVLNGCLPRELETTQIGEARVFWPGGQSAAAYRDYRVAVDDASRRAIDEIPPEELANAMKEVLIDFSSCEEDTLYRETVKLFGFSAVTSKARRYLEFGRKVLQQSGMVE